MTFLKPAIILFLILLVGGGFLFIRREKTVSGIVLDCSTNEPIVNAEVSANQRGWGLIDGSLLWDKDYISKARTDNSGEFTLGYRVGDSANMRANKEGYITAQQFEPRGEGIVVRLLQGNNPAEVTYNCKLLSECLETTVEDGIQVTRNVCAG